jgi:3-mercaptopyruvate sulfurtransferase SseA
VIFCASSPFPNKDTGFFYSVIALEEAGFSNVKLYSGSWSDWISYEENPVATGEE